MALNKNIKLQLKKEFNLDQYEKILLYVGRIDELKGINILLASYNMIISKRPESKLIIIGDGSLSILSGYINNAASKLIFTGKVSKLTLHKWYQIADVGILPSYSEECSFVGIEMMMHGLPIVASNGRGVRNMFHHMQNCLSVDCQSGRKVFEYELSEAILKILDSETLANDLRRKSRQWYLDHYQFKFMKEKYLSLIGDH